MSVNVSARHFSAETLVRDVRVALRDSGLPPDQLVLELTETSVAEDPTRAEDQLTVLRSFGVRVAIDDFGTGWSSLAQLFALPIGTLKIDRSLLNAAERAVAGETGRGADARSSGSPAPSASARSPRASRPPSTCAMVRAAGCDLAQGWLLGQPMPADEVPGWVAAGAGRRRRPVRARPSPACAVAPGRVIGRADAWDAGRPHRRVRHAPTAPAPSASCPVRPLPAARQTAPVSDSLDAALRDPRPTPSRRTAGRGRPLDLLIWDAPNIDMTLSTVIGARPTAASRPRFDAIAAWFVEGAGDPARAGRRRRRGVRLRQHPAASSARCSAGWRRCAGSGSRSSPGPRRSRTTTSTRTCSTTSPCARTATGSGGWSSSPATAATSPIRWSSSSARGTHVVVVAFSEVAGYAISSDLLEFIDIEDVPGAFVEPLDRVRLDALPPDGAWLRPTRSLRDFVSSFTARRDR